MCLQSQVKQSLLRWLTNKQVTNRLHCYHNSVKITMDIPHYEHCLRHCYSPTYKTATELHMLSAVTTEQNGTVQESIQENVIIHFFRRFLINLVCKLEEFTTFCIVLIHGQGSTVVTITTLYISVLHHYKTKQI